MRTCDQYTHIWSIGGFHQDFRNICPQLFLQLQPLGGHVADPGNFAQADYAAARNICHIYMHVVHERHMVLAIAEYADIFYYNGSLNLLCTGRCECFSEHLGNFVIGVGDSGKDFFVHSCHTLGCFPQAFSIRIFADCL